MAAADSSSLAIRSRSLAAFSFAPLMTASGALDMNFSLLSLLSIPASCFSALAFSLAMRASSYSKSTSSASGISTRAAWVMTSTMPFLDTSSPGSASTVTSLAEASFLKKGTPTRKVSAWGV